MLAENTCLSFFHIFLLKNDVLIKKQLWQKKGKLFYRTNPAFLNTSNTDWRPTGAAMASAIYR